VVKFALVDDGRLFLLLYWAVVLILGLVFSLLLENRSSTVSRKYFHALALILFTPGIMFYVFNVITKLTFLQPTVLYLCFGLAVAGFLFIEMLRFGNVWPIGQFIESFLMTFVDEKDSGPLITTHIYLLLGCAIPVWLADRYVVYLTPFAGLLIIGVGDSAVRR
jgi:dolichol kinase